ncbi:MAG: hypothetical protein ABW046_20750 [Actinoplanes sp.]
MAGKREANKAATRAKRDLEAISRRKPKWDDELDAANRRVIDAENKASWWHRI